MFAVIYDSVNLPPRKMKFTPYPRLRITVLGKVRRPTGVFANAP